MASKDEQLSPHAHLCHPELNTVIQSCYVQHCLQHSGSSCVESGACLQLLQEAQAIDRETERYTTETATALAMATHGVHSKDPAIETPIEASKQYPVLATHIRIRIGHMGSHPPGVTPDPHIGILRRGPLSQGRVRMWSAPCRYSHNTAESLTLGRLAHKASLAIGPEAKLQRHGRCTSNSGVHSAHQIGLLECVTTLVVLLSAEELTQVCSTAALQHLL